MRFRLPVGAFSGDAVSVIGGSAADAASQFHILEDRLARFREELPSREDEDDEDGQGDEDIRADEPAEIADRQEDAAQAGIEMLGGEDVDLDCPTRRPVRRRRGPAACPTSSGCRRTGWSNS